jgi:hypothetical protein
VPFNSITEELMGNTKDYRDQVEVVPVESLHEHHPRIRAADWRSPLVRRLSNNDAYKDANRVVQNSYRSPSMQTTERSIKFTWKGLREDHDCCMRTYQASVITEFATLGLACILLTQNTGQEITEVTRRGEKADYWLGDKDILVEVSGQQEGSIADLCKEKSVQLLSNPYGKPGYVCAANYGRGVARLWYYARDANGCDESRTVKD